MKLMDEVAGIVAARHCNTNIVTASVDAINFHRKIKKGCVVTVTGRLTFVSNRSMEIEVLVDAEQLVEKEKGKYRAVSAFFTFISLDKENKPLNVPPLKLPGLLPHFIYPTPSLSPAIFTLRFFRALHPSFPSSSFFIGRDSTSFLWHENKPSSHGNLL
ncbi:Cytosolic acyl coenzyme A thioester hydrolase [Ameca splendens]|uniref:Cytosolic acyl coenzyme A thioester hydrolase n=1 Tax=Ameca splendens TaxID=208324 RepID=A0ABV0XCG4_9TELE